MATNAPFRQYNLQRPDCLIHKTSVRTDYDVLSKLQLQQLDNVCSACRTTQLGVSAWTTDVRCFVHYCLDRAGNTRSAAPVCSLPLAGTAL